VSYRFFPSTSGPGASTTFAPGICQGLAFDVTSPGMVLQGYYYWRADSGQSATADFALWTITSSSAGTFISGSHASTSSGAVGQWNFVPLSPPLALTSGTAYMVVMGQGTPAGNFSDTHPYFNNSGTAPSGITNGPLNLYADPGGTSNTTPNGNPQGAFTTGSSDPTVTFPATSNSAYNPWIDVQVDFPASPAVIPAQPGRTWVRRFHHPQVLPPPPSVAAPVTPAPLQSRGGPAGLGRRLAAPVRGRARSSTGTYGQAGPPVIPLQGPIGLGRRAPGPFLKGRAQGHSGIYAQLGPAVTALRGPVGARRPSQLRGGRAQGRAGTFTAAAPQAGPPVYPLHGPVAARLPLQPVRKGRTATMVAVPLFYAGPPVYPLQGPIGLGRRAPGPFLKGRAQGRAGTFTATAITSGPPVYPLHSPVRTRPQPPPRGRCTGRAGVRAQAGPPVTALRGPVAPFRQGAYRSGRCAGNRGTYAQSGPRVTPLRGPVRQRVPQPRRGGHMSGSPGAPVFVVPPPPFTVGQLTAADAASGSLGAGDKSAGLLTGATAALGAITG
jgi:hypothetical protein